MKLVNVYEAKTNLSRLLDAVEAGEQVVIARAGRPIADLVPHTPHPREVRIGGMAAEIEFDDADFEDLDPDVMAMFNGDD